MQLWYVNKPTSTAEMPLLISGYLAETFPNNQLDLVLVFSFRCQFPEGYRSRRRTTPNTRLNATQSQPHCPPAPRPARRNRRV